MRRTVQQSGFTIIELLVVIVVIGILASITIVSYTGVTQRANTTSAQAAARTALLKFESYRSEVGGYPDAASTLSSDSTKPYYLATSAVAFDLTTSAAPAKTSSLIYRKCGTTPNTTQANLTSANSNITGIRLYYWTYTGTPGANAYVSAGTDAGAGISCPTS